MKLGGSNLEATIHAIAALAGIAHEVSIATSKDEKISALAGVLGVLVGATHEAQLADAAAKLEAQQHVDVEQLEHPPAAVIATGEALHEALNGTIDTPKRKRKPASKAKRAKSRK